MSLDPDSPQVLRGIGLGALIRRSGSLLTNTPMTAFLPLTFSNLCSLVCVSWVHLLDELPAPTP